MSEDLLFAKISEPEMTVVNFDDHFRDRMGEVDRGHVEVFPKLWNLRPYDKINGEVTRIPRLTAAYHKVREETKGWGSYRLLQYTQFAYKDEATRRRMSNAATPKSGRFDKEWAKLDLAPLVMRGNAELPEASLILTSVKPELTVAETLRTRTMLAPFGY